MTKILLLLLVCLAYYTSSAIILTPVTFESEPEPIVEPTIEPSSPEITPEPIAPLDETTTETGSTSQEESSPPPSNNGDLAFNEEEPVFDDSQAQSQDTTSNQSKKGKKSSQKEEDNSQDSNVRYSFGQTKRKDNSKKQIMVNPERSIVLMKEFPSRNAILPFSNVDSAEKTIVLQESRTFDLSFYSHTVASQVSESIEKLTLVVTLNQKSIELPLQSGRSHERVTLQGQEGPNQVVFSLKGDVKGKGIVSVVLTLFEIA